MPQRPETRFAERDSRIIPGAAHIHEVTELRINLRGKVGKIALNFTENWQKTDATTRHPRMAPGTEPRKSN